MILCLKLERNPWYVAAASISSPESHFLPSICLTLETPKRATAHLRNELDMLVHAGIPPHPPPSAQKVDRIITKIVNSKLTWGVNLGV